MEVQRLYNKAEGRTEEVDYYRRLHALPLPSEDVMKRVIKELSQRDYEEVTKSVLESYRGRNFQRDRRSVERSVRCGKKYLDYFVARPAMCGHTTGAPTRNDSYSRVANPLSRMTVNVSRSG